MNPLILIALIAIVPIALMLLFRTKAALVFMALSWQLFPVRQSLTLLRCSIQTIAT